MTVGIFSLENLYQKIIPVALSCLLLYYLIIYVFIYLLLLKVIWVKEKCIE